MLRKSSHKPAPDIPDHIPAHIPWLLLLQRYEPEEFEVIRNLLDECNRRGLQTEITPYMNGMYKIATDRVEEVAPEETDAIFKAKGIPWPIDE